MPWVLNGGEPASQEFALCEKRVLQACSHRSGGFRNKKYGENDDFEHSDGRIM